MSVLRFRCSTNFGPNADSTSKRHTILSGNLRQITMNVRKRNRGGHDEEVDCRSNAELRDSRRRTLVSWPMRLGRRQSARRHGHRRAGRVFSGRRTPSLRNPGGRGGFDRYCTHSRELWCKTACIASSPGRNSSSKPTAKVHRIGDRMRSWDSDGYEALQHRSNKRFAKERR